MSYQNVECTRESVKCALGRQKWTPVCARALNMIERTKANQIAIYETKDHSFSSRKHQKHLSEFNEPYLDADIIGATAPGDNRNVSPSYIWAFVR